MKEGGKGVLTFLHHGIFSLWQAGKAGIWGSVAMVKALMRVWRNVRCLAYHTMRRSGICDAVAVN
jgi:hypothetical protein